MSCTLFRTDRSLSNLFATALLAGCLLGCGGGGGTPKPAMSRVTGTVTLDGQPLADGVLVADPADKSGLPAQAAIVNGAFSFEATPGRKTVRVSRTEVSPEKDQYGEPISREVLPARYNALSELAEVVPDGAEAVWKLELTSK